VSLIAINANTNGCRIAMRAARQRVSYVVRRGCGRSSTAAYLPVSYRLRGTLWAMFVREEL
jgi:hypothetical protein